MSKYIQYFETLEDSEGFIIEPPFSGYVNNLNVGMFFCKNGVINNGEVLEPRIYYTSSDNNIIMPHMTDVFGASIISNTYDNVGILDFDGLVTSIGAYAFQYCSSLTSITIPNSVTSIGGAAFWNCSSLTSITLGNSVTSIEWYAFQSCWSLTSITIPNSVTSIGDYAFQDCTSLTSITIPESVTSIGESAFQYCSSLASPVYNAHCFAYLPTSFEGAYTIPDGVEQIAGCAFERCSSLTSITIPNSVESIGRWAFNCCTSLTSMVVEEGNTTYDSRDNCNAIIETATNTLIAGCQSTIIPNNVTSIGDWAFCECYSLTSITIPNSVTSIGDDAFRYCFSLTSVTIGNSVTSIGGWAFDYCTSLTSITCEAVTPPTLGSYNNLANVTVVYVPAESVDLYKNTTNWSYYSNVIQPIQ